ncbi:MAG: replicative DNA helicase [Coriobacteriia bacterium]|nr:replicative DNA helicase [Coriobacteriia bacterium]
MSQNISNNQGTRTLPHNLDAERGVLGSMLLSSVAQDEAVSTLTSQDFYRPSHKVIYDAMADLNSRGVKFDHISLTDKLVADGQLNAAGGADYLADLTLSVPTTSHFKRYADIVKKLSTYRQLAFAGTEIASLAFATPEDVDDAVAQAERRLFDVTEKQVSTDFKHLGADGPLEKAYLLLEEYAAAKGGIVGAPTGFHELDELTRGFRGGQFIVLGARPAVGKTALALNMALGAAKQDVRVGVFSLEMTSEDLALRMLTSEAGIGAQKLRGGNISPEWWGRFLEVSDYLSKLPIYIDDTPDLNINRLRVKAKRVFQNAGSGKKLLIVDYLQLMSGEGENRQNEVARISRGLKILSKDLDVPILALSQLSRPPKLQRDGKRPQLSDLRESGAIEQDADIVMFLHRDMDPPSEDEEENEDRMPPDAAKLIVAKHRNGPTRDIHLVFRKEFARFLSIQR